MAKKIANRFWFKALFAAGSLSLAGLVAICAVVLYLGQQLPDVDTLKDVQLQVPLRIYSNDGFLIAEYGEKRRNPVRLNEVPQGLIHAVLATEDQRFYDHSGVDILGLGRATISLIKTGKKSQGASTITMQVARNFFLSRKKTYLRKLNEILLAIKIDNELSKNKILELYLNKIYFGYGAYGVAAAGDVYYGLQPKELTLAQMAMLAGLPKAPSRINPIANPKSALKRRNHVLERMLTEGYISKLDYENSLSTPISASYHRRQTELYAPYVGEMARQAMVDHFGVDAYTTGFKVYTSVDSKKQRFANQSVIEALRAYDKRHGYRGAHDSVSLDNPEAVKEKLHALITLYGAIGGIVVKVEQKSAAVILKDASKVTIEWSGLSWAHAQRPKGATGPAPEKATDVVKVGDIIYVRETEPHKWILTQIPDVEGALVSMDPEDGAIKALVGGYSFYKSKYNRITQASRQPGSIFKPFVYAAALSAGYTLATLINDAPIVKDDPTQDSLLWRPENYTKRFYGPTRLRIGLIRSRNLVSIRLLDSIGIPYTLDFIERFGFNKNDLPNSLSLALGAASITPLELATGYCAFANGGYKINPYILSRIEDSRGNDILNAKPKRACIACLGLASKKSLLPEDERAKQIMSPQVAYLMNLALKDNVQRGTGRGAKVIGRTDLAGKTGTTNDYYDAWFAGFNTKLVTVAWLGFDQPKPIYEYSFKATAPMWVSFMAKALKGTPNASLPEPNDLVTVRIDPLTGLVVNSDRKGTIYETFRKNNVPQTAPNFSEESETEGKPTQKYLF